MNRSYSKTRHIQESNIILERRMITEQTLWVQKAASGPQKCGKDAAWYKEPKGSNRRCEPSDDNDYVGKNPYDSISNYKSYDDNDHARILSDFKRDINSLPQGVVTSSNVNKIKHVPPIYVAAKRDSDRLSRVMKNENYTKWFDQSGRMKPEAESFKNNFESWFLYYYPFFVGKTTVTPVDILNHFASKGGLESYEQLVNNHYKK